MLTSKSYQSRLSWTVPGVACGSGLSTYQITYESYGYSVLVRLRNVTENMFMKHKCTSTACMCQNKKCLEARSRKFSGSWQGKRLKDLKYSK